MKNKLPLYFAIIICAVSTVKSYGQSNKNIGIGTNAPDPSAVLDISSDSKGILIPRLTSTQRYAIQAPANGLIVYDMDSVCLFYYNNFKWTSLCNPSTASNGIHIDMVQGSQDIQLGGPLTKNTEIALSGKKLMFSGTGNVSIGNNTPDPSAILDLSNSNNTGMIVPKVALSSTSVAAPVTSPALTLLVFNTATQGNVTPGYYFWDGGQWVRLFSTNLPVVSTVSVTAPIVNNGTAQDPNIGITTSDLTSNGVIAVTGGASRLTGPGGASIDVTGANGGVLYGTGTSSTFTPAGNTGEILKSNGAAAPTWVSPNSTLTTYPVSGSNTVAVYNGNNQVVGSPMSIDIKGAQGALLYGTGASSDFTATGVQGQYLQSNGISTPTWVNGKDVSGSSVVSVTNGTQQVVGSSNMAIDVKGPAGTLLYGNGASSAFTNQGNAGELLQSNGTGAPTWVNPNAALSVSDLTGGSVINVTNGTGKVVGSGGANVDVSGTAGAVLYGTGTSSGFTAQGTNGQVLKSAGAAAPTWVTPTDVNGSTVVSVTNGIGQAIGNTNMNIDVKGANGGVLYGTGTSSDFTPAGTAGQVLKSTGAGAPVWASPNATLATNDVTGGSVMNITNGTGQIVGGANMNVDVKGTDGGLLYGTGTSSNFTPAGTAGQYLQSNGGGAPSWTNRSNVTGGTVVNVTNGNNQVMNGAMNVDVKGTNGGVLYGTGSSSDFTPAGTAGQVLKSTGAGAPVWSSPNATLATNDVVPAAGSAVVVNNGTGQVVGGTNVSVDVQGTNGGVFYGKGAGTAAAFSAVGTTGQILKSNGAAAPTWVNPNTTLTTNNVTGGAVMNIGNGSAQVVGAGNLTLDVAGTNGGVLYGTGTSSNFSAAGTSGQILKSNGAAAPTWVNTNTTLTTNNITNAGNGVITVTGGSSQIVGATNATVDVAGTNGGVLYGTGTSSNFSAAGTSGQILKSNGAGAPTWVNANTALTTSSVTSPGVVSIGNGTGQVVGATNMTVDVVGTNGGVLYGTGTSSGFSAAGTSGQILKSNGAAAPTWVNANTALTTQNITNAGNGVVTITGGASQVVGATNATIDVAGTNGGVLYGTGSSSAFTSVGTAGQVLTSNGAGAPTWQTPATGGGSMTASNGLNVVGTDIRMGGPLTQNTSITQAGFSYSLSGGTVNVNDNSNNITNINTGTSTGAVNIANGSTAGTVQIGKSNTITASGSKVGINNPGATEALDVTGNVRLSGALMPNNAAGTAGQVLTSAGAGAPPTWTTPTGGGGTVTASNGLNVVGSDVRMGGTLTTNTSVAQAGFSYSHSGGVVNLNDNSNSDVNIATGTSTGNINMGTGASTQAVNVGTGAGAKTVTIGSTNGASATDITSGTGGVSINENNNQATDINTGTSTGAVNIANGSSAGTVQIGKSNTVTVTNSSVGIGTSPISSAKLDVSSTTQGFAPPRMTKAQRDAIASPAAGLMVYNIDCDNINYYSSAYGWKPMYTQGFPTATAATSYTTTSFSANWTAATNATGYYLDVSTVSNFATFVTGYNNLSVGNVLTYPVTGLSNCGTYYYRVRAMYCAGQSENSNTITAIPHAAGTQTFTSVGTSSFTVPCGVTSINVQLWGAGGGGTAWGGGGSGAYVTGTVAVTPGSSINIIVGGGGGGTTAALAITAGSGGGGAGGNGSSYKGGGGGGRSAVQLTAGTDVITAGGGGGGGGYEYSYYPNGGGGGATTNGIDGYNGANGAGGGKYGTIAAGGAAGTGTTNGTAGSSLQGGNGGGAAYAGGGGGGGYFGGGGGGSNSSSFSAHGAGGGGASYVTNGAVTGGVNTPGNQCAASTAPTVNIVAPYTGTGYVTGVGEGGKYSGATYFAGGPGEVILTW